MGQLERLEASEQERRAQRERRATPRINVGLSCHQRIGTGRALRHTRDVSTFGLSTAEGSPLPPGSKLTVTLRLPDQGDIELPAEVLGAFDHDSGMRLRFVDPPLAALQRLHKYLVGLEAGGQAA